MYVANESHDVWLHHLTLMRSIDRLINVEDGATDVTLSWLRFEKHNKVMLFNSGSNENIFKFFERDSHLRVTLHNSYFIDTVQRNPRAQIGGTSHIFNNLLENWDTYGMSFSLEHRALVEGNIFSNTSRRPCTEPEFFDTIEDVRMNFCKNIPTAPKMTALPNGSIDKEDYDRTKQKYQYTHDWRAFLRVRDNLYLGDAKPVLADYMPEKVPLPPYCYAYEHPDEKLAARIRAQAGHLGQTAPVAKNDCPAPEQGPFAHQRNWGWVPAGRGNAAMERKGATSFVLLETGDKAAEHGIQQWIHGWPGDRWRVQFTFKPIGGRGVAVYLADARLHPPKSTPLQASCDPSGAKILSAGQSGATAKVQPLADGTYRCDIEGTPGKPGGSNLLRFDIVTFDGVTTAPRGQPGSGAEISDLKFGPLSGK